MTSDRIATEDFVTAAVGGGGLTSTLTSAHLFVGNGSNVATDVALSGDASLANTGALTIGTASVTLAKMANLAANSIIGNNTGAGAAPIALTTSQVKSLLAITEGDVASLTADLAAKQPLDADLTTIAGLTATTDNFLVSVASAWASRTPAQVRTTLALVPGTNVQAWDADLDTLAANITAFGQSLVDDANAATALTTLGLDADLATFALPASTTISTFGASLIDDAAASNARTTLGLGTMATQAANAVAITGGTITGLTAPLTVGSPVAWGAAGFVGAVWVQDAALGLSFVATEWNNGTSSLDLRSFGGTPGAETATPSGQRLGIIHIGGWGSTSIDCATIEAIADATFSATQSPIRWEIKTTPIGTNTPTLALTIGSNQSLTVAGALSAASATFTAALPVGSGGTGVTSLAKFMLLNGTTNVNTGAFGILPITTFALPTNLFLGRINGTAGSPTAIANADSLFNLYATGQYDTTVGDAAVYAVMQVLATQAWTGAAGTPANNGLKLVFGTVANGAHALSTALTLDQDQSATFAGALTVTGHVTLEAVTSTGATGTGKLVFDGTPTLVTPNIGAATGTSLAATGLIKSSSATAGVGYATGAGGTATQATSRTTTVVLNKICGTITLFSTTLAADTDVSFTWTNSAIAATDLVVTDIISGAAIKGGYSVNVIPGAGTATVTVHNHTPTITATEAPVIAFAIIKGVTA